MALVGLTVFATALILQGAFGSSLLRLVVLPVILFAPGYALVSLLFPAEPAADPETLHTGPSLGVVERLSLAVALSVGFVPTVALVLNFTPIGIRPGPVLVVVAAFVVGCSLLALVARLRVDPDNRFETGAVEWVAKVNTRSFRTGDRSLQDRGLFDVDTTTQQLLNVVLVGSILVFGVSLAFAAIVPTSPANDESFTEFYVLGENESGALSAESVPSEFGTGDYRRVHVAIANREGTSVEYTTVVLVQRVRVDGSQVSVMDSTEIDRFSRTVGPGETQHVMTEIGPQYSSNRQRVVFLLYKGEPPADPGLDNAYRFAQIWITVGDGGDAEESVRDSPVVEPSRTDGGSDRWPATAPGGGTD